MDFTDRINLIKSRISKGKFRPVDISKEPVNWNLPGERAKVFEFRQLVERYWATEEQMKTQRFKETGNSSEDWIKRFFETRNWELGVDYVQDKMVEMLECNMSDDEIQEEILELVGYDSIDVIFKLIQDRRKNAQRIRDLKKKKENESINESIFSKRVTGETKKYPHVYGEPSSTSVLSAFGTKIALPAGTERYDNKLYEEFVIPSERSGGDVQVELVPTYRVNEFSRVAFSNIETFNMMQSLVFPVIYERNENVLVCAPTGAGKTNVALLAIMHCVEQYTNVNDKGNLDKDAFKIVYVAPMKALATEIVGKFEKQLKKLGVKTREYTGDMQLSRSEIAETQIIVTTPEKWDVTTRKNDVDLVEKVRLLIIDEVHLLEDERGSVLESIVARTQRQIEMTQKMIRIVGLSATLPNFVDVAEFLNVNVNGMFYFDGRFRPVPLTQKFVGIKGNNKNMVLEEMDVIAFERTCEYLRQGHQVMIFVHSRNATFKGAKKFIQLMREYDCIDLFEVENNWNGKNSRNRQLEELVPNGLGIHHAGMIRGDRLLVEKLFETSKIKVLFCTATLAWGVNLPAHAVIIKGTEIYNPEKGGFVDLGILDVLQIFGRAGRPQYESHGEGIIITRHEKLNFYVSSITHQIPIESKFNNNLVDNLNAEITLGTVSNLNEAINWLKYSYLYVRMRKNPLKYGIRINQNLSQNIENKLIEIIKSSLEYLNKLDMIGIVKEPLSNSNENLSFNVKSLGRIASLYYLKHQTVEIFQNSLKMDMDIKNVLNCLCSSFEFQNIKVRQEEVLELDSIEQNHCLIPVLGGSCSVNGKVNILLQSYISNFHLNSFSLISDTNYIIQNASRLIRSILEISLKRNWASTAEMSLNLAKMIEKRLWLDDHFLFQFRSIKNDYLFKIQKYSFDELLSLSLSDLSNLLNPNQGKIVFNAIHEFPNLFLESEISPISNNVVKVNLKIKTKFTWNDSVHSNSELFWIFAKDSDGLFLYHSEPFYLTKQNFHSVNFVNFFIPIANPKPNEILISVVSDKWLRSGKTLIAEFTIWNSLRNNPNGKIIYFSPLKQIVKDKSRDWKRLNIPMNELRSFSDFDVSQLVLSTPEKWMESIQENQNFNLEFFSSQISLIIIDEIHLLDLNPSVEILISHIHQLQNFNNKIRMIVLSTSLSNVKDVADWLKIPSSNLFNFKPNVRPLPLQVYIQGFDDKNYSTRMNLMNKPIYQAIETYSSSKPTVVFVSSQNQTVATAHELIAHCTINNNYLKVDTEIENVLDNVQDQQLKHVLRFGIGFMHYGLKDNDKRIVRMLFSMNKILVLVLVKGFAWESRFPAHLVIIKGTEYFDSESKCFVDYPLADIHQMMGLAGRPQIDEMSTVVVLVQDIKKSYYKKFLYEPFPLESNLHLHFPKLLLSQVKIGNIKSFKDALALLENSFLANRVLKNPSFYGLKLKSDSNLDSAKKLFLEQLVEKSLDELKANGYVLDGSRIIKAN
ncbi:Sec63-domain-containing protein [Rozella allomycis CSF55]|uniref:Sec63-domain-containing protein n=1 Tax=Rozella allomycis (strain CSF55) TaxID=988480 RepID=A0A4P9YMV0_ROZAC|nr:Sec63-domain-containing protein [Rozella allomycis CSF55]